MPFSTPTSYTFTTLGLVSPAADWASAQNLLTNVLSWLNSDFITLIATYLLSLWHLALYTSAIPPVPICSIISYLSAKNIPSLNIINYLSAYGSIKITDMLSLPPLSLALLTSLSAASLISWLLFII